MHLPGSIAIAALLMAILSLTSCGERMSVEEEQRQVGLCLGAWRAIHEPDFIVVIRKDLVALFVEDSKGSLKCTQVWCEPFFLSPNESFTVQEDEVGGKQRLTKLKFDAQDYTGEGLFPKKTSDLVWVQTVVNADGSWVDGELLMIVAAPYANLSPDMQKNPHANPNKIGHSFVFNVAIKKDDAVLDKALAEVKKWLDLQRKAAATYTKQNERWALAPNL